MKRRPRTKATLSGPGAYRCDPSLSQIYSLCVDNFGSNYNNVCQHSFRKCYSCDWCQRKICGRTIGDGLELFIFETRVLKAARIALEIVNSWTY